jgi:hypothetical protein
MAQSVQFLPCKHEALSSNSSIAKNVMVVGDSGIVQKDFIVWEGRRKCIYI